MAVRVTGGFVQRFAESGIAGMDERAAEHPVTIAAFDWFRVEVIDARQFAQAQLHGRSEFAWFNNSCDTGSNKGDTVKAGRDAAIGAIRIFALRGFAPEDAAGETLDRLAVRQAELTGIGLTFGDSGVLVCFHGRTIPCGRDSRQGLFSGQEISDGVPLAFVLVAL